MNNYIRISLRTIATSTRVLQATKRPFVRSRPNVNVATLGPHGHGKTTLCSTLTKVSAQLFKEVEVKEITDLESAVERKAGHSQNATHFEIYGKQYRYSVSDLPGHPKYLKNLVSHLFLIDSAILVISSDVGVVEDVKTHYNMAKFLGKDVITFINQKDDASEETTDLIKCDLTDLLSEHDMQQVISGQASDPGAISNLLDKLEARPQPLRDSNSPLIMPLEQTGVIPTRGTFVAGRVRQGRLQTDTPRVEVFNQGPRSKISVRDIEIFKQTTPDLQAGDRGGAFIKLKLDLDIGRGATLFQSDHPELVKSQKWILKLTSSIPPTKDKSHHVVVFHFTSMIGQSFVEMTESTSEPDLVLLTLPYLLLAKKGDPVILRLHDTFAFGRLVDAQP